MKLRLNEIAEELIEKGFTSNQVDSDELTNRVIEILANKGFFENLHDEMTLIEDENHPEPKNLGEYLEKIGEI
jgi:hypothetical protein